MSKKKKFLVGMGLSVAVVALVCVLASCGERAESTKYYYGPSLTRGGSVIFVLGLQSVRKDFIGTQLGSSYNESVNTMDTAGAGEAYLFDATGAPPYGMSCSPTTDYVGYLDDLRDNLFRRIVLRNIGSGAHSGLDKVELAFNPGIKSFDWSSDGTRLVYCTTNEVRTVKLDGTADTLVVAAADLTFVSWKNGGRIAFVHGGLLSLIYADGTGRLDLTAGGSVNKPQISATNTSEVYGLAGGSYCKVDVSAGSPATTEVLASFKGESPRLAQAADLVVYSKSGEQSGIYVLNLAAKSETKIK
jgi:hypothetical protein